MDLNVDLLTLEDGRACLATNSAFPAYVTRVEYIKDNHLMMIVFDTEDEESELMHYEVAETMRPHVENAASMAIIMIKDQAIDYAYEVPLVQIGI